MRLVIEGLEAERGGETIFSGLGFSVDAGRSLLVTGPNGAGKSTLLRVIAGLLPAAAGTVRLEGAGDGTAAAASHYLGHDNAMKAVLTVEENLGFWQDFLGQRLLAVGEALDAVGLADVAHLPFGYLSTGQRRRIAIARLLVSRRPLWLLDEPTAGLDAASARHFAGLMREHLEGGGMVVAATHLPLGLEGAAELAMEAPHPC